MTPKKFTVFSGTLSDEHPDPIIGPQVYLDPIKIYIYHELYFHHQNRTTDMLFGQNIVERNEINILHNRDSYLGEQILGLGSGTVWHGLPSLTAKNYL